MHFMTKIILTLITTLVLTIQINAQVNNLIAHYPLNGNANDVSGYRNNGTAYNPTYVTDRFGNLNGAMFFSGNTYIDIPDSASLRPNQLSMSAWVLMSAKSRNANFIISKGYDGSFGHYGLNILSDSEKSQAVIGQLGSVFSEVSSIDNIAMMRWTHICSVYDGVFLKIYINGTLNNISIANQNYNLSQNTNRLLIGRNDTENSYYQYWFIGIMDDIRIYNKPLSDLEVTALYNTVASVDEIKNKQIQINKGIENTLNFSIPANIFRIGMTCQLYDINGRLIMQTKISTPIESVNMPAIPSKTVYFVRLVDNSGTSIYSEKIRL